MFNAPLSATIFGGGGGELRTEVALFIILKKCRKTTYIILIEYSNWLRVIE